MPLHTESSPDAVYLFLYIFTANSASSFSFFVSVEHNVCLCHTKRSIEAAICASVNSPFLKHVWTTRSFCALSHSVICLDFSYPPSLPVSLPPFLPPSLPPFLPSRTAGTALSPEVLPPSQALILGKEDFLSVLTSCIVCVVKSDIYLTTHLLSWGFLESICLNLKRALDFERRGEPITCTIRLLYQLAGTEQCSAAAALLSSLILSNTRILPQHPLSSLLLSIFSLSPL